MPDHRFVYTVSGVKLTQAQQERISRAISIAVAEALVHDAPGTVRSDFLNIQRIYGGRWIDVAEAEKIGLQQVLNDRAGGAAAQAPA